MGLLTISLRFFNVYGPRQSADGGDAGVIPIFYQALKNKVSPIIYGDGRQTRDFIHVYDAVEAIILSALVPEPSEDVFNIGTGQSVTISEVLSLLREYFPDSPEPVLAPPRPGDPVISEATVSKAKDILRFETKINLREGLKTIVLEL
jgi:nucleoside-diphosphate-sugar epimerase